MPSLSHHSDVQALRAICVRVMGARPGCGFPVAAGWLVTCAHVVGRGTPLGERVEIRPWRGAARKARLCRLASSDLALLEDGAAELPAAIWGEDLRLGDPVAGIGFPEFDCRAERDLFTAEYEGETDLVDQDTGTELTLLKLKAGQIEHGFSGGPVLNLRTGQVVGVTRLSKDTHKDLGGWAIPPHEVAALCRVEGIQLPMAKSAPAVAVNEPTHRTLERVRDLLIGLPGWTSRRRRHSFVAQALGKHHRVLEEVEWEGGGRQLAWEVASACDDFPEPTASGLSPLCALLASIPGEFGPEPARDAEIADLWDLLQCSAPPSRPDE